MEKIKEEESESFKYGKAMSDYQYYIEEHISNIKDVWSLIMGSLECDYWVDDLTWQSINSLIEKHDESKYTNDEFEHYRQYFYPVDENSEKDKKKFNIGWNHHQKSNPHHWEYWVLIDGQGRRVLDMPFIYIFEMLCDWTAMSFKFKDKPSDFYNKNKKRMTLSDDTRSCLLKWLPLFDSLCKD